MRLVDCLERADIAWCAIGGLAVNHWAADIHGILMRVASLEDTLRGKIKAWKDTETRQSKKIKDLGDIARLVESHPHLWDLLSPDLKEIIQKPSARENNNE
jgi:hypothetical protein